ncbi:hypothetical protein CDAR_50901 [Caerostris darwini]|uniref:Uncharacterized protein n=1 Tax=Caerostris darwini TaxID=1538125 RepID=A0AAV4U5R1_9ARAC|nr:hypothetical protein CDAR_50901 [Caerostris darwini]
MPRIVYQDWILLAWSPGLGEIGGGMGVCFRYFRRTLLRREEYILGALEEWFHRKRKTVLLFFNRSKPYLSLGKQLFQPKIEFKFVKQPDCCCCCGDGSILCSADRLIFQDDSSPKPDTRDATLTLSSEGDV